MLIAEVDAADVDPDPVVELELVLGLELLVLAVAAEDQADRDQDQRVAAEDEAELLDRCSLQAPVGLGVEQVGEEGGAEVGGDQGQRRGRAAARPASRSSRRPTSRIASASSQTRPIIAIAVTPRAALRFEAARARRRLRAASSMPIRPAIQAPPATAQATIGAPRRTNDRQRGEQHEQVDVAERFHVQRARRLPARQRPEASPAPPPRRAGRGVDLGGAALVAPAGAARPGRRRPTGRRHGGAGRGRGLRGCRSRGFPRRCVPSLGLAGG